MRGDLSDRYEEELKGQSGWEGNRREGFNDGYQRNYLVGGADIVYRS